MGCSSFVQEATREGEGGAGEGAGPRDGSQRTGVMDTTAQSRLLHSTGLRGHTRVLRTQKTKMNEIKAVRRTPHPPQVKHVTPWAGGRGR